MADGFDQTELDGALEKASVRMPCRFFDTIDSTNRAAKELGEKGETGPCAFIADRQTGGRGRRGRSWSSPPGTGIFLSILLSPPLSPSRVPPLTLVAALAVSDAVRDVTGIVPGIKWPNDLTAGGKKLCGILTELSAERDRVRYAVVGLGINVNNDSFPEELKESAVSLKLLTGRAVKRSGLAAAVLKRFEERYGTFVSAGGFSPLKADYEALLVNRGRTVRVLDPVSPFRGTAVGITEDGALLVETEEGLRSVGSGEVSVRGLYGYT